MKNMVSPEERVLAALEFRETDRIPVFDIGLQLKPALNVMLNYHYFPAFLQRIIDRMYENVILSARRYLGFEPPTTKRPLTSRILPLNSLFKILSGPLTSPTGPLKQKVKSMSLYFESYCRLGVDAAAVQFYPSLNVIGQYIREGKTYLLTEDYETFVLDTTGDLKGCGVVFEKDFRKQIAAHRKAIESFNIEENAQFYEMLCDARTIIFSKKFRERLCFPLMITGFFETWYSIFGYIKDALNKFFRQVFKEYRQGLKGPYLEFLRDKLTFYKKIIKRMADTSAKIIFIGEDFAMNSGPFIRNEIYGKYFAPLIKDFVDYAHKYDMRVVFHSDGRFDSDNWQELDTIVNTGIDALHPIQSDVNDIGEIRNRYPDLCLTGGIDCTNLLQQGTPKQVFKEVARIIKKTGKRGLMLGSDNSIHSGIKVKNYLALVQAVKTYGRFP